MKRTLTALALLLTLSLSAQRYIEYQNTGIMITTNAINQINCQVRWVLNVPLTEVGTAINLLPQIQGKLVYHDGQMMYSDIADINAMYAIMDTAKIVQADVDKTGNELTKTFSLLMLYEVNPLGLKLGDWTIKGE